MIGWGLFGLNIDTATSTFNFHIRDNNSSPLHLGIHDHVSLRTSNTTKYAPDRDTPQNATMGESRQELLAWLNGLLQLNMTKVEQCGTGYVSTTSTITRPGAIAVNNTH